MTVKETKKLTENQPTDQLIKLNTQEEKEL